MILSNGSTELRFINSDSNPDTVIEQASATTAGGRIRTQIAGERYKAKEKLRMTGGEYRSLMNLLKNATYEIYYTPDVIPAEYSASDFPISVRIDSLEKTQRVYNGQVIYYVDMELTGAEII